jgi:hypothetical protein
MRKSIFKGISSVEQTFLCRIAVMWLPPERRFEVVRLADSSPPAQTEAKKGFATNDKTLHHDGGQFAIQGLAQQLVAGSTTRSTSSGVALQQAP